jgi:hypothetical protein
MYHLVKCGKAVPGTANQKWHGNQSWPIKRRNTGINSYEKTLDNQSLAKHQIRRNLVSRSKGTPAEGVRERR